MSTDAFWAGVAEIESLIAAERANEAIDPRCLPILLHHGASADRTLVLFHGFTNCPRQFADLAQSVFARGFNVYVPRLPRHGLRDKLTTDLAALTIDELTACAAQALEYGRRLGGRVSILGLSVGATMAAWLAQTQPLDIAVAVAPFFSVVHVPSLLEPALAGALAAAPNAEIWWDPRVREHTKPAHAYPRFATHALAHCLQLGQRVRSLAQAQAPLAARSTLVINAKDPAIDNAAAGDVWQLWRKHGAVTTQYVFENLDARHDIIEPTTYHDAQTLVYPVLLDLLGG